MFAKAGPLGLPKTVDSARPEVAAMAQNVRALLARPSFVKAIVQAIEPMVRLVPLARISAR